MVFGYCCPCRIRSRGAIEGNFLLVRWTIVHIGQQRVTDCWQRPQWGSLNIHQHHSKSSTDPRGAQQRPLTEKTHLRISNTNSPVEAEERKLQRRIFTPNGALLTAAKVPPHAQWEGGRLFPLSEKAPTSLNFAQFWTYKCHLYTKLIAKKSFKFYKPIWNLTTYMHGL